MTYTIWNGAGAAWNPVGDYLLDWNLTGADGAATLTSASGDETVGVTVSTPTNAASEVFSLRNGQLCSNDVSQPVISEIAFEQPVAEVNFQLIDVDRGCNLDDAVTILAYDADGNLVDVDFDAISGAPAVSGTTIEGEGTLRDAGIAVSVSGPIVKLVIVQDNGSDAGEPGRIELTGLGFNCAPMPAGDGSVAGTGGDDLIDFAHAGDAEGDRVVAGDALLSGERGDEHIFLARGGDDLGRAGAGDDAAHGGDGVDKVVAGADDGVIFGGSDDDTVHGGDGDDVLDGGSGNDRPSGGDDRDWFADANPGGGDDRDTLDLTGSAVPGGSLDITYTTADRETGYVEDKDAAGNDPGVLELDNIEKVVPCFTPGTLIATPKGEVPVENLRAGDRVITRDNGIQEIKWVGSRSISFADLAKAQHLAPIQIRAGALGNGLPERDMMLSPNHRVLVANDRTSLYFDEREVLAAAKHLVDSKGIRIVEPMGVSYLHFMCRNHEVVLSNGAWTESFQPGDHSLKGVGNAQRQELFETFPELKTQIGLEEYTAARRILKEHEAQLMLRS